MQSKDVQHELQPLRGGKVKRDDWAPNSVLNFKVHPFARDARLADSSTQRTVSSKDLNEKKAGQIVSSNSPFHLVKVVHFLARKGIEFRGTACRVLGRRKM